MTDTTATTAPDAEADLHAAAPETDPNAATWLALAEPFPVEWIEKLPKPVSRNDDAKARCEQGSRVSADGHYCGGWHARSVHLDYIGHAGITMRLNKVVGPGGWDLEALETTEHGAPVIRQRSEFWARLTILGVSKVDVATNYNSTQEAWGDALRRCAMRFGIGTYLWAKSEYAAELAQHREPDPGQDPATLARDAATRLESFTGPVEVLDRVIAHARENQYADQPVTFKGNPMTLEGAVEVARADLRDAQARAEADAAQDTTTPASAPEAAETPQEPASAPPAAQEPPTGTPAPTGDLEGAYDVAREALTSSDADLLRALYRGSGDLRELDVLAVLGDDDLAALDAPADLPALPLGTLLLRVADYVKRHGAAVRDLGEPLPQVERTSTVDPADPWAKDAAEGWPDRHTPAP